MRIIAVLSLLLLASCAQVSSLGVAPDENALACIKGTTGPLGLGASGIMIDAGNTDTTNYTAEDWKALAEICD